MPGRVSRPAELLEAALAGFAARGYEGTSVSDLVERVGMSKAAFSYHFPTKDRLLEELVTPLLDNLESAVGAHPSRPDWTDGVRVLLADYPDVLVRHRETVMWIDGDKSVFNHPELEAPLRA